MIELALTAYNLKSTDRTGWLLRGIRDPESVADHSWGTALLCLLYGPAAGVDVGESVKMALVHDLAEALTGDIPTRVAADQRQVTEEQKRDGEERAMTQLSSIAETESEADFEEAQRLWRLYEERSTPEALFVRDMNLIDMCLQALLYEKQQRYDPAAGAENFPDFARLDEFFATSGPRIATGVGRTLYDEILERYQALP